MIVISDLTKRFGSITAVDGLSMTVARGEVLGFLGPNGAGKSTTMRMVTGYLPPTAGKIVVCGHDVSEDPIAARRHIGYLPEGAPLYGDMSPIAYLNFIAQARGFARKAAAPLVRRAVETVELQSVLHQPIDTLSKGFKRRVGLAQAMLHDPEVLILDEPTDGLDPNQKRQVRSLIRDISPDKAIVISTHILEEVEAVCTRAVIIAAGRVVFDGSPAELRRRSAHHNAVTIRLGADLVTEAKSQLEQMAEVARVEVGESEHGEPEHGAATLVVVPRDGRAIVQEVGERVRSAGLAVNELFAERGELDEVFYRLTVGH